LSAWKPQFFEDSLSLIGLALKTGVHLAVRSVLLPALKRRRCKRFLPQPPLSKSAFICQWAVASIPIPGGCSLRLVKKKLLIRLHIKTPLSLFLLDKLHP